MDEKKKDQLKDGLAKLDEIDVDELTDEDLESVAGGADMCSLWCCSDGSSEGSEALR